MKVFIKTNFYYNRYEKIVNLKWGNHLSEERRFRQRIGRFETMAVGNREKNVPDQNEEKCGKIYIAYLILA